MNLWSLKTSLKYFLITFQTDVIVNSTSQDLNLTQGAISSSILRAAGPGLQRECKEKYPKGITGDEVACTNSFNMRCKAIFHVALCNWANEAAAKVSNQLQRILYQKELQTTSFHPDLNNTKLFYIT